MAKAKEQGMTFCEFLDGLSEGDYGRDATAELDELTRTLRDQALYVNGKVKGKLTLTLDVSIDPRGVIGTDFDVKLKLPKKRRATAQAWIAANGRLTLQHPTQLRLPSQELGGRERARELDDDEREGAREV